MNWQRSGEVGMLNEPFRVGKFFVDNVFKYGLWHNYDLIGYFSTFEECQEAAEKHGEVK